MKVIVLGGLGLQGRAALTELSRDPAVERVVCADADVSGWPGVTRHISAEKCSALEVNASSAAELTRFLERERADVVIDLLPLPFMANAFEAAVEAGVPIVGTNYAHTIRHLDARARERGVALMPECGLDPGIDLIICGNAVRRFDAVHRLDSFCGGFPEPSACDNPLKYKISWNWDLLLRSQKRDSIFLRDGKRVELPAAEQHRPDMVRPVPFPGLGDLEGVPNGDAAFYVDLLGCSETVRNAGRYALRWPGWCAMWHDLKGLGLLSDEPVPGIDPPLTPHQFMVKHLGPRLRYGEGEKDLAAMINQFEGTRNGERRQLTVYLLIERDLDTGLLAMSRGVAAAACIVARMLVNGEIRGAGLLNPAVDVPYESFMAELSRRGLTVREEDIPV